MFSDALKEDYVQVGVHANDWRGAVRKSLAPLLATGAVDEGYVDDIIRGAEEHGPYFVITRHVAIPHARPECGAHEEAVGITVLDEPVSFGNADNDPVRYLFPLSAPSSQHHLEALSGLFGLLSDKRLFDLLDEAKSAKEVVEGIHDIERSK